MTLALLVADDTRAPTKIPSELRERFEIARANEQESARALVEVTKQHDADIAKLQKAFEAVKQACTGTVQRQDRETFLTCIPNAETKK